MGDEVKLVVLFGRLLEILRARPGQTEDEKAALGNLAQLATKRSYTLRVHSGHLTVDGIPIPPDTPFGSLIIQQFAAHDVGTMMMAQGTSALDLLHTIRSIARDPSNYPVGSTPVERLRDAKVSTVMVVTRESDEVAQQRRKARLTEAIEEAGTFAVEKDVRQERPGRMSGMRDGTAYQDMVQQQQQPRESMSGKGSLAATVEHLRDKPGSTALSAEVDGVLRGIEHALDQNQLSSVVEALLALIRAEEDAVDEEARRAFAIAIRRSLTGDMLRGVVKYLLDELYAQDTLTILRRAGIEGTRVMVQHLIDAPSFAERKAYLGALREVEKGTEIVTGMLRHGEWFVVRNAADLVGDLRVAEAVPLLGEVTSHEDRRVRLSVALALAKIGTPETARYLRGPLRDADPGIRLAVARSISGKGLAGLAMMLVTAAESEEDEDVMAEYYRALGRIGTPEAVQALIEVVNAKKGLLSGRKASPRRQAAVEGLGYAGTDAARASLQELTKDRDRDVRDAARAALDTPQAD
jgi:HEAT repeat protein